MAWTLPASACARAKRMACEHAAGRAPTRTRTARRRGVSWVAVCPRKWTQEDRWYFADVDRIRIGVYVVGSLLAAIGGLMEAGRVSAVTGTQGYQEGIIFAVFAAAVIGGVSLRGGRGNMVGAASGVVLLGLVQNILDLSNVSNYWIEAVDGGVILFALLLARMIGGEATAE